MEKWGRKEGEGEGRRGDGLGGCGCLAQQARKNTSGWGRIASVRI